MWKIECCRCGGTIESNGPEDVEVDVDGNPRHEDCEYADKPDYPFEASMLTSSSNAEIQNFIERNLPYLKPDIERNALSDCVPPDILDLGNERLTYRLYQTDDSESIWDSNIELIKVNGERLSSSLPRVVYECEKCGEQVDGKVEYTEGGYRPFVHTTCSDSGFSVFKPVEISYLDNSLCEKEKEDILEEYKDRYSKL